MSNGTSQALNSEQDLASIPTAQGGLSRLAIARLTTAGVPVVPLLKRVGLTPEVIADPQERLSVRSQVALLDEAAIALKDDCLGFTLARDFDPREIGLLYYVMASSQTLGDALCSIQPDYQRGPRGPIPRGEQANNQSELLWRSTALGQTSN
jgi:Arabinose-binding domain of AraC transcription regulator, N-term